jgi:hypothetical protein
MPIAVFKKLFPGCLKPGPRTCLRDSLKAAPAEKWRSSLYACELERCRLGLLAFHNNAL